ncbi:MAG TPA: type II toxin-antitoxin system PemK/MazF family toxin [Bacteriovoracaceae bacterium]|nr:type II toxin-antitoxin system PemK/MazF family toxin [Bacteriovoracaceae bacterium]
MMTLFKPFDVVIVPFPFIDTEISKLRPALVISSNDFNSETGMVTCLMITSSTKMNWSSDVKISHFENAGLKKSCRVRFKMFSIQSSLVRGVTGTLGLGDQKQVKKSFSKIFMPILPLK